MDTATNNSFANMRSGYFLFRYRVILRNYLVTGRISFDLFYKVLGTDRERALHLRDRRTVSGRYCWKRTKKKYAVKEITRIYERNIVEVSGIESSYKHHFSYKRIIIHNVK